MTLVAHLAEFAAALRHNGIRVGVDGVVHAVHALEALGPGEMIVIPRGVAHRPVAEAEVEMLIFEPAGVRNTGNVVHDTLTAPTGARLGASA